MCWNKVAGKNIPLDGLELDENISFVKWMMKSLPNTTCINKHYLKEKNRTYEYLIIIFLAGLNADALLLTTFPFLWLISWSFVDIY